MSATTVIAPASPATADNLRRVYFARFVFAAAWAATFAGIGGSIDAGSVVLLLLYPVVDVAAAILDVRTSRNPVLYVNIAISTLATIGFALAAADDIPAVLRVWGVWAVVAGLVQLIVALRRRTMGGQWPMILAGGISLFAGTSFVVKAGDATSMTMVSGYAALGGIFFLASAVRLYRQSRARRFDQVA